MLALRDRAYQFLVERGTASEDELLRYMYGGSAPAALGATLRAPLLEDSRLARSADGTWSLRRTTTAEAGSFTALVVVASGANPARGRVVRIVALHGGQRFDVLLNPLTRVPRYVLVRLGLEIDNLEGQPVFGDILSDLVAFLEERPVFAQDVRLAWDFLDIEARRVNQTLPALELLDFNQLAMQHLDVEGKPSLAVVAARLGVPVLDVQRPEDEARVLGLIGAQYGLGEAAGSSASLPLRKNATVRDMPDEPGVYVLRDGEQIPLYVGKARRLRSRMAAYVHRPLGATRRLEGLVGSVEAVDTTRCETDLEALVLEDREIRRLQPRYNTVRQQRVPRYWIELPEQRVSARGRALKPPRLELSLGPHFVEAGAFVGPFRNEALAEQARLLARQVFELDGLRATDPFLYADRLAQAWSFLHGDKHIAESLARRDTSLLRKVVAFDVAGCLLAEDPRTARYAVVRPSPSGLEGFLIEQAILRAWCALEDDDVTRFAARLLEPHEARTTPEDRDVVLRWLGAQRPSSRLIAQPDADAIEDAALVLLEARAAGRQDPFDSLV